VLVSPEVNQGDMGSIDILVIGTVLFIVAALAWSLRDGVNDD